MADVENPKPNQDVPANKVPIEQGQAPHPEPTTWAKVAVDSQRGPTDRPVVSPQAAPAKISPALLAYSSFMAAMNADGELRGMDADTRTEPGKSLRDDRTVVQERVEGKLVGDGVPAGELRADLRKRVDSGLKLAIEIADQLPKSGPGSMRAELDKIEPQRQKLGQELGLKLDLPPEQLGKQFDEMRADAAKRLAAPGPGDNPADLQARLQKLDQFSVYQAYHTGMEFLANGPTAARLKLAELHMSGEFNPDVQARDSHQPTKNDVFNSFALLMEASIRDGSVKGDLGFQAQLKQTVEAMKKVTDDTGTPNLNFTRMMDYLVQGMTSTGPDSVKALERASRYADGSDVLKFMLTSDVQHQRDPSIKDFLTATILGVQMTREQLAKAYIDQGNVGGAAALLTKTYSTTPDVMRDPSFNYLFNQAFKGEEKGTSPSVYMHDIIDAMNPRDQHLDKASIAADGLQTSVKSEIQIADALHLQLEQIQRQKVRAVHENQIQSLDALEALDKGMLKKLGGLEYLAGYGAYTKGDTYEASVRFNNAAKDNPELLKQDGLDLQALIDDTSYWKRNRGWIIPTAAAGLTFAATCWIPGVGETAPEVAAAGTATWMGVNATRALLAARIATPLASSAIVAGADHLITGDSFEDAFVRAMPAATLAALAPLGFVEGGVESLLPSVGTRILPWSNLPSRIGAWTLDTTYRGAVLAAPMVGTTVALDRQVGSSWGETALDAVETATGSGAVSEGLKGIAWLGGIGLGYYQASPYIPAEYRSFIPLPSKTTWDEMLQQQYTKKPGLSGDLTDFLMGRPQNVRVVPKQ